MGNERSEFRKFWESRTGITIAFLMLFAALENRWSWYQTDPERFPDLNSRFKIERNIDSDGIYRLAVYRSDFSQLNLFDNDLGALERKISYECGKISKFSGTPDAQGNVPVNYRLLDPARCIYKTGEYQTKS